LQPASFLRHSIGQKRLTATRKWRNSSTRCFPGSTNFRSRQGIRNGRRRVLRPLCPGGKGSKLHRIGSIRTLNTSGRPIRLLYQSSGNSWLSKDMRICRRKNSQNCMRSSKNGIAGQKTNTTLQTYSRCGCSRIYVRRYAHHTNSSGAESRLICHAVAFLASDILCSRTAKMHLDRCARGRSSRRRNLNSDAERQSQSRQCGLNWSPERHGGGAGALDDGTEASKLRIIEASYAPGESVSSVARRHGAAPNLLYRQRRLMTEGGGTAVGSAIG
jgi:hypothetical protein